MGTVQYSRLLTALGLALVLATSQMTVTAAQCSDCWFTPTPTPTGTWIAPTPSATPTGPYPLPATVSLNFPNYPVPTSIQALQFPDVPDPLTFNPIPAPSPISISITPIPTPNFPDNTITATNPITLTAINTTLSLSYTTPLTLDTSGGLTGSTVFTAVNNILITGTNWISGVISYTDWLSGEIGTIQATQTFTLAAAPDWYAPDLPRPMADVGWTWETLQTGIDTGFRYSLPQWAWFFGYSASLPFQLLKVLRQIFQFLGPLGLFVIWLMVMFPLVLFVKFFTAIRNFLISLLNFVFSAIRTLMDIIDVFTGPLT